MNRDLSIESVYTVDCHTQLNSFDRKIITALYQPIIGYEATSLYFTLWSEVEIDRIYSNPAYFTRIIKIMNIDVNTLVSSFNILEGIGLVKTLYNNKDGENCYLLKIFSPELPNCFFKNPLLSNNLKSALGIDEYNKTKFFFNVKELDETGYQDISKKYRDVFSLNFDLKFEAGTENIKEYKYATIENEVDFSLIKDALKPYNLHNVMNEDKVCKNIEMLLLTYKITTNDIIESIIECSDNYILDLDELNRHVEMKEKIKAQKTKLDLIYVKKENSTNKYEKNSVFEYLKKYCSALKIEHYVYINLETIMKDYNINYGVLNVLLEYVINKSGFINLNYLKAIVSSWCNEGINSVELASKKINDMKNKDGGKRVNYGNKKVIGSANDWYQVNDDAEMSDEEKEKVSSILKQIEEQVI